MATYVMSDIHGEGRRFYTMLDKIGFGPQDQLYILGDVIDRGTDGVVLLWKILSEPNMHLIIGNHEQMCLDAYSPNASFVDVLRWTRNGSEHTMRAMDRLQPEEREALLSQLAALPDHVLLTVGDRHFYLVHGFAAQDKRERIWGRPDYFAAKPCANRTLIVGHTPVVAYSVHCPVRDHFRILHAPGFIDIDCGCGHRSEQRRLACLRLEDMREFYC